MATKKNNIPEPVFLSAPKAANLCGVSRNTICCWIRDDKLPSYRTAGGKYLIRPGDLLGFMNENQMFAPQALKEIAAEDEAIFGGSESRETEAEPSILVVDDDANMRQLIRRSLQDLGMPVLEAENGFDAMHKLTVTPSVALVILDMVMPGQGGASTFEQIRKANPSLPVIIVTGQNTDDVEREFTGSKPEIILSKPIRPEHLVEVANTFLNNLGF
ncbi:MAG: response regulator [Verrucomicrobia bacterium]|nr:response regulator [Verrucomicrobiota bacterium]MCH8511434.1 response regulator [Kiritimatiellia bacterium]